ncbi:cytochrome P450 CYP82D47-like [Magnolia sinica]|uniref:cytochrome P450 CYP82D47-like n=1 Tax=Magnolia sinica TaxID=86752 RepID=UPI002658800F|nr:cytochrome P450 CYP82D47-like [Magnolia sinica]
MELLLQWQALIGLFTLLLLYKLCLSRAKFKKINPNQAPEPSGAWPIIGHLHQLGGREPVARTLAAMAEKNGPTFMLRLGMNRTLVVSSWEVVKECFTTNDKALATRPSSAIGKHFGYDYAMVGFSPYGPYWREIRKIMTLEILSNRHLESFKHIRATEIDTCVKGIYNLWVNNRKEPVTVEMKRWFGDLTFNATVMMVAGKRFFGTNISDDEDEAQRFRCGTSELLRLTGVFVVSDALPFLKWMDLGGHLRAMMKTAEELDVLITGWLEEHRRRRSAGEAARKEDFIDVLLSIMEDAQISSYDPDTIIKATSLAVVGGGTDTTAITLTWALSLLMNNRHVLKKAQAELDLHVGKDRHVEESDIKNLVYLQAIAKETMCLYPAAPLSGPHEAMEDCHIGGFYVPVGTRLLTNIWKLHRDPNVWQDPSEFQPERFLTDHVDVDVRGQHFEYVPFGSGRRICPGISFALQVLHLTLARLIHGFDLATPMDEPVDMTEGIGTNIIKESRLEVLFSPRLPFKLYE